MRRMFKYISLFLLIVIISYCGEKDIRLYPSLKFAIGFEFGNVPGEPPGEGGDEDEESIDIEDIIKEIEDLEIEGTVEEVVLERMGYQGTVDYDGELEELELNILLIIDDESYVIAEGVIVPIESLRAGEDVNLSGDLNEEGVILLKESIQLLVEKIVNEEDLDDFNRSIKVTIVNLPPDEEIYVHILTKYILAVRYKETITLL
jgi:hypothetical protein